MKIKIMSMLALSSIFLLGGCVDLNDTTPKEEVVIPPIIIEVSKEEVVVPPVVIEETPVEEDISNMIKITEIEQDIVRVGVFNRMVLFLDQYNNLYSVDNKEASLFLPSSGLINSGVTELNIHFSDSNILINTKNNVYTLGSNHTGQLGNGTFDDSYESFIDISSRFFFQVDEIITASLTGHMSLIATNKNNIYIWGLHNLHNQYDVRYSPVPVNISYLFDFLPNEYVVEALYSGGTDQTMILKTNFGNVWVWGQTNGAGLGRNLYNEDRSRLVLIDPTNITSYLTQPLYSYLLSQRVIFDLNNNSITNIKTGYNNGVITTSENRIIHWGENYSRIIKSTYSFELGPHDITDAFTLEKGEFIVDINSLGLTQLFLTNLGKVYLLGTDLIDPPGPDRYIYRSAEDGAYLTYILPDNNYSFVQKRPMLYNSNRIISFDIKTNDFITLIENPIITIKD